MLDGLIVGLDMLCRFCGTKKYRKRIFLITDGEKEIKYTSSEFSEITKTIKENDIKLNCITLDFCNDLAEDDSEEDEAEDQGWERKVLLQQSVLNVVSLEPAPHCETEYYEMASDSDL